MAKRLTRTVFVDAVAYGPTSSIPPAIAARITNPKVWTDSEAPADPAPGVQDDGPVRDPDDLPAADWTVKELRDFAKAKGVVLGEAKAKDAILAVLAEQGLTAPDPDSGREPGGAEGGDSDHIPEADGPED